MPKYGRKNRVKAVPARFRAPDGKGLCVEKPVPCSLAVDTQCAGKVMVHMIQELGKCQQPGHGFRQTRQNGVCHVAANQLVITGQKRADCIRRRFRIGFGNPQTREASHGGPAGGKGEDFLNLPGVGSRQESSRFRPGELQLPPVERVGLPAQDELRNLRHALAGARGNNHPCRHGTVIYEPGDFGHLGGPNPVSGIVNQDAQPCP